MTYCLFAKQTADSIWLSSGRTARVSFDLGISFVELAVGAKSVEVGSNVILLTAFKNLRNDILYTIRNGSVCAASFFAEDTNHTYALIPTKDWPALRISSTPMHRHAQISPKEDAMLRYTGCQVVGKNIRVLDTCCGLGYGARTFAEHGCEVFTFERDEHVLEIAKLNPFSEPIFTSPLIHIEQADISQKIPELKGKSFSVIIHDPPTPSQSPALYELAFYKELYRVLTVGGILYHYTPLPQKTHGRQFHETVMRTLKNAGFVSIRYDETVSGVFARR